MPEAGHNVLVIPVPELEPFVRARWQHYDPAWVSRDPAFVHAHITALAPFLPEPTADDLVRIEKIAITTAPFEFTLSDVAEFPNGLLHLRPHPDGPFVALTRRLWATFPQCPPYGGEFEVAPHLTLDQRSSSVTRASTSAAVDGLVPIVARADRLELQWYEAGDCHVQWSWPLSSGSAAPATPSRSPVADEHRHARLASRRNHPGTRPVDVPANDGRDLPIPPEHRHGRGVQMEVRSGGDRQAAPAHAERAGEVPVAEEHRTRPPPPSRT